MNTFTKPCLKKRIKIFSDEILEYVIKMNTDSIYETLHSSLFQGIPCKFYYIDIKIDLISLCNIFPEAAYLIIKDIFEFSSLVYTTIKNITNDFYNQNGIENSKLLFFDEMFDVVFIIKHAPLLIMKRRIRDIYNIIKSRYKKKEEIICKTEFPLFCINGNFTKIKSSSELKSSFYICNNNICDDKTHLLKLKNVTYIFKDSKKTFISISNNDKKLCLNCKSRLTEKVNLRVYASVYEYICTDGTYNISCTHNSELSEKSKTSLGILRRRKDGNIYFQIFNNFIEEVEIYRYFVPVMSEKIPSMLIYNQIKVIKYTDSVIKDIESYILQITRFIFTPIKNNCDTMDALLLIILNICTYKPSRLLLFTTDPLYVNRCAYNLFKIKNVEIQIFSEIKSLKNNYGLCVRGYNERNRKITNLEIDYIFHIPLNHFLDYSYTLNYHNLYIENKRKDLEDDNQNKNLQIIFIEFRKVYKSLIEPERLLNMLKSIYLSIIEFVETDYDELNINNFIIKQFIDKLI